MKRPTYYLTNKTNITDKPRDLESLMKQCPGSKMVQRNGLFIWTPPTGGAMLNGEKQHGKGDQNEGQEPLFTAKVPLWLKGSPESPWIVKDNKDGARFQLPGWRMTYTEFVNSGEDCVTCTAADGLIQFCTFRGDGNSDKCVQALCSHGLVVSDCTFMNFITAVAAGSQKRGKPFHTAKVLRCTFKHVERPILSVRGTVFEGQNNYGGGQNGTDNGGRITQLKKV